MGGGGRNVSGVLLSPVQPRVLAKPQGVSDEHQSWMLLLGLAHGSMTLWLPKALASMSQCKSQAPRRVWLLSGEAPVSPRKGLLEEPQEQWQRMRQVRTGRPAVTCGGRTKEASKLGGFFQTVPLNSDCPN